MATKRKQQRPDRQPRVGLYARISLDRQGLGLGVARQEKDARDLAARKGWVVYEVYDDNDKSAYKKDVVRPNFLRMLEDLRAGVIDGVVGYNMDRITRRVRVLEDLLDIYEDRSWLVWGSCQGELDLTTSDGQAFARMLVLMAQKASADTARRVADQKRHAAALGDKAGGRRGFGHNDDKRTLNRREADATREAVVDVYAGKGISTIAADWARAGILTPGGKPWSATNLKALLRSPRLAGYRVYQGGIAVDYEGNPVTNSEPILEPAEWEALVAFLDRQPNQWGGRSDPDADRLLSGVCRCGSCGHRMWANTQTRGTHTHTYFCPSKTNGGCGGMNVVGPPVDELVTALVLERLRTATFIAERDQWDGQAELDAAAAKIDELMDAYNNDDLGPSVFKSVRKLELKVAALTADRNRWLADNPATTTDPASIVERWPSMSTTEQRQVISVRVEAVVIAASATRGRFQPSRVDVAWK